MTLLTTSLNFSQANAMTDAKKRRRAGYIALACSTFIICAAFLDDKVTGNLKWIMLVSGLVFGLAGVQLVTAATGRSALLVPPGHDSAINIPDGAGHP